MTSDPDDALRWDGDDDRTAPSLPRGWKAVGKGSERVEAAEAVTPEVVPAAEVTADAADAPDPADAPDAAVEEPSGMSTAMLLSLGVVSGVYLLYAVGWAIGGARLQTFARFVVSDAMYVPWMWLAVLAPALWFIAAWVLTRGAAFWTRLLALLAGIALLVPWPFVLMGAFGS